MLDFQPLDFSAKERFCKLLPAEGILGCEYSFVNLYCWGRQKVAFLHENATVFSQFNRKSVYLFPVGTENIKQVVDAIIEDAAQRGIPCRLTGLTADNCRLLQALYPDRFRYHTDRDSFDYVYPVAELAELAGRKYQRKRNHVNRFYQQYPDACVEPLSPENLPQVQQMVETWYAMRMQQDPTADFQLERAALTKALRHWQVLGLEGLVLRAGGQIVAMTMGSFLNAQTFDVHFEKALDPYDGVYTAINREFARNLRDRYPSLIWLNREDDMGIEGLRKAKMSYQPQCLVEKYWACLLEEAYDY